MYVNRILMQKIIYYLLDVVGSLENIHVHYHALCSIFLIIRSVLKFILTILVLKHFVYYSELLFFLRRITTMKN